MTDSEMYGLEVSPECNMKNVSAHKVKSGDLHVPNKAGNDEWVWLELDCSEAGHGKITAEAKHENGVNVEVDIKPINDNNRYCVKFKADHSGKYNLAVFYGGKPIPGSPYSDIEILDLSPKQNKVKHLETKQPEERGGAAVLLFDAKEAGKGEFRARVAGLQNSTSLIKQSHALVPGSDTTYKISFIPHLEYKYLIDVYWDDHPIPKSPFFVEIVYPNEVIVTPPSEDSIILKCPFYFGVDTSKAGPGKLTAKCKIRENGKEVKAVVSECPKEAMKFTVSVNPDEECVYSVSILFNKHHAKGSPFDIDLRPKLINECHKMSPITKQIVIIDLPPMSPPPKAPEPPPLPTELQMFIGEPFSCVIGPENFEHKDKMTATAVGMKTGPVEIIRKKTEEDLPCFFFNPDVADKYTIEIRMNSAIIPGNFFVINYIYPVDASKCVIFGTEGLSEKLTINKTISFGVDASRAGNGKLSVNVDGPSSLSQPIEVSVTSTEENPNIYHISYLPTARGKHSINLQWAGEPIPDSPVVLDVDSSENIPTFFLKDPFVIYFTTDCDPKEIESYAIHEDTCHRYALKIGKRKGGKLNLILYAKELGIHSVHILIGGKEIHGSPFKVLFIESDPSACKIVDVPQSPPVGMETSFKVNARNAGSGNLHIKAKVPHGSRTDVDITHVDHKNGIYSIVFTPKVPGNHTFQVSWAGVEIPDSPVMMEVISADPDLLAASRVYIVQKDLPIFNDILFIMEPAVFHVSTIHAGKGQLTIRATGPYKARIKVVDQNDGTYKCNVYPKVSGNYLISILWNGFPIQGSPFNLNFTDGTHVIHGLKLETDYFTIGTPREYIIDCGKEQGSLKVDCHPKEAADVELTPLEGKDNTYLCKIIPQIVGNHDIHVTYNEQHTVLESPYVVHFHNVGHPQHQKYLQEEDEHEDLLSSLGSLSLGGDDQENDQEAECVSMFPNPAMVKVFGLKSSGYVGQEGNFRIETAEAGDGKLEVNVRGPKGTFQINMRHHPDSDRTILARYNPKHASEYTIDITWSGSPIPHSPFVVNILEQHPLIQTFEL